MNSVLMSEIDNATNFFKYHHLGLFRASETWTVRRMVTVAPTTISVFAFTILRLRIPVKITESFISEGVLKLKSFSLIVVLPPRSPNNWLPEDPIGH